MEVAEKKVAKLIPELRFTEFNGEWEFNMLQGKIDLLSGTPIKTENISELVGGIPILRGINVTEGYIRHNKNIDRYFHKTTTDLVKFLVEEGDLVLGMDGSKVGKNSAVVKKYDEGAILIQRVARLRENNKASLNFIYHHINSSRFHRYVDVVNTSSGIPHISLKQINEFKIHFPTLPEQKKIASFLSAVDEKINQLNQKANLLTQYKKGAMQQLFSGKLRFKTENGDDFGDWEEKKLGEVATFLKGKGISKANLRIDGNLECIRYGELYTVYGESISVIHSRTNLDENELVLSQKGDVIIPASGETQIDIATASCVLKSNIALGGDLNIIRSKNIGVFLAYYLNNALKFEIARLAQGVSVVHLYSSQLKTLKMKLPVIKEQEEIANYLTALDDKLEQVTTQIEKAKAFKKGLLQQMFV